MAVLSFKLSALRGRILRCQRLVCVRFVLETPGMLNMLTMGEIISFPAVLLSADGLCCSSLDALKLVLARGYGAGIGGSRWSSNIRLKGESLIWNPLGKSSAWRHFRCQGLSSRHGGNSLCILY